jgi:hypothetical protein
VLARTLDHREVIEAMRLTLEPLTTLLEGVIGRL